jgi:hypothetical protein
MPSYYNPFNFSDKDLKTLAVNKQQHEDAALEAQALDMLKRETTQGVSSSESLAFWERYNQYANHSLLLLTF